MNQDNEKLENSPRIECKVYKRRWIMLGIFVIYSASNAMQWIQYSIIANVIVDFYGVSSKAVDWTSMIYMITYIPLIFPGSYLLDKKGLRVAALLGSGGTCVGAWIKVLSVAPDRFWVAFIGQSIVAVSQVFVLSVPARLAAVWFGTDQVSSACSIGVFGNQLGVALGFVLPPMLVRTGMDKAATAADLTFMFYGVAIFTTALFLIIIFVFKAAPPLPPSFAQIQAGDSAGDCGAFLQSVKRLASNYSYVLLVLSYGINAGIFYAISTLLNQIILLYYPNANEDAGRIGLTIVFAGMIGSVCCGIVLDKFHRFKETTLGVYILSLVGMIIFTFTLDCGIVIVYICAGLLGFFMTGLLPVGFELAAELTYPEPEGTSAGILNAACQVFGIAFTSAYSELLNTVGDTWANVTMCSMLGLGSIFTAIIKSDLRRQAAATQGN